MFMQPYFAITFVIIDERCVRFARCVFSIRENGARNARYFQPNLLITYYHAEWPLS